MQRRFSPRINAIADEKRPYYSDDQKKPLDAHTDQGRRVSPKLRYIPDCERPYYGSGKRKPLEACEDNVRKKSIPDCRRPYYGSGKKRKPLKACEDNLSKKSILDCKRPYYGDDQKKPLDAHTDQGRRVSPRLHNIPNCERPYYGIGKRKPLEACEDNVRKKSIPDCKRPYYGSGKKRKQLKACEDNLRKKSILDCKRPYYGDDQKKPLDAHTDQGRRVSPRLRNIPDCERPYYGSGKRKPLEACEDNARKKSIPDCKRPYYGSGKKRKPLKACEDNLGKKSTLDCKRSYYGDDQKKQLDAHTDQGRRVSPRLRNIPNCERPYYGSGKRKPLEACEDNVRKKSIPDCKRPYYGSVKKRKPLKACEDNLRKKSILDCKRPYYVDDQKKPLDAHTNQGRRVSSRLRNIPDCERPYYGSGKRKPLEACEDNVRKKSIPDCKRPNYGSSKKRKPLEAIVDFKRPYYGNEQKKPLDAHTDRGRRVSPRLRNIPICERPYYGSGKRKPLEACEDNVRKKSIPECKRPYYGSGKKRKPLKACEDNVGKKSILDCKRPYYASGKRKPLEACEDDVGKQSIKVDHSVEICQVNMARDFVEDETCSSKVGMSSMPVENRKSEIVHSENNGLKWTGCSNSVVDKIGKGTSLKVKKTLRLFRLHCLQIAEEEKKRCNKVKISDLQIINGSKSNKLKKIEIFKPDKKFSQPTGIEVGHQFFSQAEMLAVGFHGHWLGGNDHMKNSYSKLEDYCGYTSPLAVTILLSGQCEDDVDNSGEIVYNCLRENDLLGNKTQANDQVLHLGNLALKHNVDYSVPVRVIRGHECTHTGKVYTFDGLYKVVNCMAENDVSGYTVFKYCLKRLEGQPKLALKNQDHLRTGQISRVPYQSTGLMCIDVSNGQEDICIPATNVIDNPPVAPSGFTYIKSIQVAKNVTVPPNARGCNCKGSCTNVRSCSCAQLNGCDFPYVDQNGGRLIEAKNVIFECGPRCGCGPGCVNRTTQQGLRHRLEVYRTKDKGWAVRSWDFIHSGAPVCEYTGVLRRSDELDSISENDYIFEIDCWQTMNEIGARERRLRNVSVPPTHLVKKKADKVSDNAPEFCIDAGVYGNVARFINHSCEPNLFVQCVLSSHHDIRLARVVLFAADDIPPMQELTYDYGYELDSVVGPEGKIKKMPCNCGTADCRKRLF